MPKLLIALIVLTLAIATGCGGDGGGGSDRAAGGGSGGDKVDCNGADGDIKVDDVLAEPPEGLQVVEAESKNLEPVVSAMRKELGDKIRSIHTRAIVPEGKRLGTAFILINGKEETKDPRDVVEGARDAAKDQGNDVEEITVADRPAALVKGPNGYQVGFSVNPCSAGLLIDQDRDRITAVAEAIQAPADS